jgi:hypothetical protein
MGISVLDRSPSRPALTTKLGREGFFYFSFEGVNAFSDRNLFGANAGAFKVINTGPDTVRKIHLLEPLYKLFIP